MTLIATAGAGKLLGPRGFLTGQETPVPVPWVVFVPLVYAYAVASLAASPAPGLESLAYRRINRLNKIALLGATALALGLLRWSLEGVPPPLSTWAATRDFLGLLGLSLVCVVSLGVAVGWTVPSGMLFTAIVLLHSELTFLPVDWLLRTDADRAAIVVALVFLLCGVLATYAPARTARQLPD